jgi:BlaR1 peptidase M56
MREILSSCVDFLNHFGQPFCDFAGTMLVQVTILVIVLLAIELVLRNRVRAVVRYWLWLLVLVKLVLPVGLHTPASLAYWLPTARPQSADAAASSHASATSTSPFAQFSGQPDAFDRAASTTEQSRTDFAPWGRRNTSDEAARPARSAPAAQPVLEIPQLQRQGVHFGLWIAGVALLLTMVARRALWVRRIVRQATDAPSELREQLRDCLSAMGTSRRHVRATAPPSPLMGEGRGEGEAAIAAVKARPALARGHRPSFPAQESRDARPIEPVQLSWEDRMADASCAVLFQDKDHGKTMDRPTMIFFCAHGSGQ